MHIWWLNLRPTGGTAQEPKTREQKARWAQDFCRERSVLGMGWRVEATEGEFLTWDDYRTRRDERRKEHERYDPKGNVDRWKGKVRIGDLVWTKTEDLKFWLARITGDWHYDTSNDAKAADIVNQRPAMIVEIGGRDDVPRRIVKGGRQTVEEIHAPEKMGEVVLPPEMNEVIEAVPRHRDLLPENLAQYCALWQRLRGPSSE